MFTFNFMNNNQSCNNSITTESTYAHVASWPRVPSGWRSCAVHSDLSQVFLVWSSTSTVEFFCFSIQMIWTHKATVRFVFFLLVFFSTFHNFSSSFSCRLSCQNRRQCLVWSSASGPASDSSFTSYLLIPSLRKFLHLCKKTNWG